MLSPPAGSLFYPLMPSELIFSLLFCHPPCQIHRPLTLLISLTTCMPPSKHRAPLHSRNSLVFWEAKESHVYIPTSPIHRSLRPCPSTAQRWSWPSPQKSSRPQVSPVFGLFGHEGLGCWREEPPGECQRHSLVGTHLEGTQTPSSGPYVHVHTCSQTNARIRPICSFSHPGSQCEATTVPHTLG